MGSVLKRPKQNPTEAKPKQNAPRETGGGGEGGRAQRRQWGRGGRCPDAQQGRKRPSSPGVGETVAAGFSPGALGAAERAAGGWVCGCPPPVEAQGRDADGGGARLWLVTLGALCREQAAGQRMHLGPQPEERKGGRRMQKEGIVPGAP